MYRRTFLATSALGATALAGCGSIESRSIDVPTVVSERPAGSYVPGHIEGMARVGSVTAGPYELVVTYSYPHRFWMVTGTDTERVPLEEADSTHLMATVRDRETGLVVPEVGLSMAITREGSLASQETIYAMLSQTMGLHHGANFSGLEDGREYDLAVTVGTPTVRLTGAFRDRFTDPVTETLSYSFDERAMAELRLDRLDRAGERGALEPMGGAVAGARAPEQATVSGRTATTRAGDARYLVALRDESPPGIDSGPYLAVIPHTRYNRIRLSRMGLSARFTTGGGPIETQLTRTFDPELGYHYGTALSADPAGESISLLAETPPQVARHEGYETAFFDLPTASVQL
ncbi:hypothetical protein [Halorhabdus sp. CUG00001]|uniref:DUF7350 domain-containing protein n=1 Tax=Halorhabdus sp. CUG00001 TaxID=2600297 RepID=UPI00131BF0F0|nr:hypothetical protein [Halorhabdus sp. CUG00001]